MDGIGDRFLQADYELWQLVGVNQGMSGVLGEEAVRMTSPLSPIAQPLASISGGVDLIEVELLWIAVVVSFSWL